jgi:hypothetical protein
MFGEISGSQGNEYEDHHLQDGSSSYKLKRLISPAYPNETIPPLLER